MSAGCNQLDLYTLTPLALDAAGVEQARQHQRQIELAESALDAVAGGDGPALLALPAGFLRAATSAQRDQLAEALLSLGRRAGVGLVFAIDVAPEAERWGPLQAPPQSFGFACERGERLWWAAPQQRAQRRDTARPLPRRTAVIGGARVGVVQAGESFVPSVRSALQRERPDLVLVLVHARATDRWQSALAALSRVAPVVVVEQGIGPPRRDPAGELPPRGWSRAVIAATPDLVLQRFRPPAHQPAMRAG